MYKRRSWCGSRKGGRYYVEENEKEEKGPCHIRSSGSRPHQGSDEISFLLAMAQRNSRKAEEFFKKKEEKSRPSRRSGKEVRFKK